MQGKDSTRNAVLLIAAAGIVAGVTFLGPKPPEPRWHNACTYRAGALDCYRSTLTPANHLGTFSPKDIGIVIHPDGSGVSPSGQTFPPGWFVAE